MIAETGLAGAVLKHPANRVGWLADKIAPHDEQLIACTAVLVGSFTRPTGTAPGANLPINNGPLGTPSFRFV